MNEIKDLGQGSGKKKYKEESLEMDTECENIHVL